MADGDGKNRSDGAAAEEAASQAGSLRERPSMGAEMVTPERSAVPQEPAAPDQPAAPRTPAIREQPVSLIELFYDLIYVYAISKMTSIIEGEGLTALSLTHYLAASFVVLQAWMYTTNYVNRFGRSRGYENAAIVVNMGAAIFMSNTISADWGAMLGSFNGSMLAILGTVAVLYLLRLREGSSARETALFSLRTLVPACALYGLVFVAAPWINPQVALVVDIAAVVWGIFGPALVDRVSRVDVGRINFPHLAERFELITIVTFGEAVVTVAEVGGMYGVSLVPVEVFAAIILFFGCYVVFMHNMVEHHQVQRGLRLIYCHFFVVIAVNLLTVAINLMVLEGEPGLGACALGAAAIGLYFLCLYLLYPYRRAGLAISRAQWVVLVCFVAVGMAVALLGAVTGALGFILGPVIAAGGCFGLLYKKDKGLV